MEKNREKKNRRFLRGRFDKILGLVFIALLTVVFVVNILVPDAESSEVENRTLAQAPSLSAEALTEGTFSEDFEEYETDQFAGRDVLRNIQMFFKWLSGSRLENGVYLGKDGQLLEETVVPDEELLSGNVSAINAFASEHSDVNIDFVMVPDAGTILSDSYPLFAEENKQPEYIENFKNMLGDSISWTDASSVLKENTDEKLYYKTDHHWTTLGAYLVMDRYLENKGMDIGTYEVYTVSDDFNGSLSSTSGFCPGEKETIEVYAPDTEEEVLVSYLDDNKKTTTLYDTEKLLTKDQYAVFMGGNYSLIDIKTTAVSDRTLLLFKDSFANCAIPFLTGNYKEIIVVDPRYYYGTADELMSSYAITDVLFLYSANTFFEDNNIQGVFE